MKKLTQKMSSTNMAQNIGKRNFFQKTFILLAILAFTSFGFKAQAQTVHFTINNTASAGCNWNVRVLDGSTPPVDLLATVPYVSTGGSGTTLVANCLPGIPNEVRVTRGLCTVSFFAPFTYTAYTPPCVGSCSTTIDCSGGTPNICGGSATDWVIVLQIQ